MAYYDRLPQRHNTYYSRSRDPGAYKSFDRNSYSSSSSYSSPSSSYEPRAAQRPRPPPLPTRSSAYAYSYRPGARNIDKWPPSPSVEDEADSLAREFPSHLADQDEDAPSSDEAKSRGTVDQYPIIEEVEQPNVTLQDSDERRFVLVSDPSADINSHSTARDRRKSFAERGNMHNLNTAVDDPPVFTKRVSTPYAYTKPQKESTLPSSGDYFLSPESITPSSSSIPRSVPNRDTWEHRHRNPEPLKNAHTRSDSLTQSPRTSKNDMFDDTDTDTEDTTHLRTARKPARYSFVKSDFQKEHLRTSVLDSQSKTDKRGSEHRPSSPSPTRAPYDSPSSSSKSNSPASQSPRSSAAHLNNDGSSRHKSRSRPSPIDSKSRTPPESRPASPLPFRPSSPLRHEHRHEHPPPPPSPTRSPQLRPRKPADSPPSSRPSSRAGGRPTSPLSFSEKSHSSRVPITEADWHSTYPPATSNDRPRPPTRYPRHETMPISMPQINVKSPSPARLDKNRNNSPLPYPADDKPAEVYMPPEEAFQFDHSLKSPSLSSSFRQPNPSSPKLSSSPNFSSPRHSQSSLRPSVPNRHTTADDVPRVQRVRSNSIRSQSSNDGRRSERRLAPPTLDKPLPSCPRSEPSAKHDTWYTLQDCLNFDICPTCYHEVFAETTFAPFFHLKRENNRSIERFCDFSSPWMRLAWLLTVRQQRPGPDLLYALARIIEEEKSCPKDRELTNGVWYGIPDPRDGIHITNFTVCPRDFRFLEALFPSVRGYFARIPPADQSRMSRQQSCSLRVTSRRYPKYLDLLVDLDEDARLRRQPINLEPFIQLARSNAFKSECRRDTSLYNKPWHFIPQLPEFTVCEECYDELVWPAMQKRSKIANLFSRTVMLVPGEDQEGTSCCLYSGRMRRVWEECVANEDFRFLRNKALERKEVERRLKREGDEWRGYLNRLGGFKVGGLEAERAREMIGEVEEEWREWE
ncbi:hypothetical protein CC78DRAFT_537579 [Lojkania enalia]|uniref:Uncharacterized protein n=1 Tax=Lojkania enalia TaxID=147567 RepID=A0A9P4JYD3_9PLEO|nr:hypothetical protein CC78DRAFT_537579 [Didymosphaeria enalia]